MVLRHPPLREISRSQLWIRDRHLLEYVLEVLAVEFLERPDVGRRVAHRLLRSEAMGKLGSRRRSGGPFRTFIDNQYGKALARVREAEAAGGRQGLLNYAHTDRHLGLTQEGGSNSNAAECPSLHDVLSLARRTRVGAPTLKPEDVLFDACRGGYHVRNEYGRFDPTPRPEAAFNLLLLQNGWGRKHQDDFKANIQHFTESRPILNSRSPLHWERGVVVRNTYEPPELQPRPGRWWNIRRVLLNLVGGNADHLNYLLDWLAAPVQSIRLRGVPRKMGVSVVLMGPEGAGKGTLETIMRLIYGASNTLTIGQNELESRFTGQLAGKLFVVANEVMSSTNRSAETQNRLKTWITDSTIPVEQKHRDATVVPNTFNIMFTSNSEKPVLLGGEDRRYSVFITGPKLPVDLSRAIHADLERDRREAAAFLHHLLSRRVQFQVGEVAQSQARETLLQESAHSDQAFARVVRDDGWLVASEAWTAAQRRPSPDEPPEAPMVYGGGGALVLARVLNAAYQAWCKNTGRKPRAERSLAGSMKAALGPGATSITARVDGKPTRVWLGIPMHPSKEPTNLTPTPTPAPQASDI
jgi:hypothetical protein